MGLARFLRVCLMGVTLVGSGMASSADVVILSSERSPSYMDASQAAVAELIRLGIRKGDIVQLFLPEMGAAEFAMAQSAKVWVTLGSDALGRAISREARPVLVAALIPRLGFERLMRDNPSKTAPPAVAVYLDQPFGRQLDLVRLVLPKTKRIGVLWGPESLTQLSNLSTAVQTGGFELVESNVTVPNSLFSGLKTVLDDADVLLAVADTQVYNGATISNILLTTYRARVPVVAFSPAYVKAGALMAVYSTPRQMGVQAAELARAALQGGALQSQYPHDFSVAINEHVARSLGSALDEAGLNERMHHGEKRP